MGARPVELYISKADLGELIRKAIRPLKYQVEKIWIKVDYRMLFVPADSYLMVVAIGYVLENSIEAIRKLVPAESGRISIAMKRTSGMAVVEITDNGCGMTEDQLSRIRTMLSSKNPASMTRGFSLFMVAKILDLYHGSIEIDSKHTRGTSVVLSLPLWTGE